MDSQVEKGEMEVVVVEDAGERMAGSAGRAREGAQG